MARVNIEDSLFKDGRFLDLAIKVGCRFKALGMVTSAWILAQEHWIEYGSIPKKAWPKQLDFMVEVELAEKLENGNVYIKGSKAAFKWLEQRVEAGRKGGLKNGPQIDSVESDRLATDERPLPPAKPLTLPLTLISSSSSDSTSDSHSDSLNKKVVQAKKKSTQGSKAAIRGCIPDFEFDDVCKEMLKDVSHNAQNAWIDAYQSVNFITHEVRRAKAWIATNPKKAPKDFGKFMLNWLSRGFEEYRKGIPSNRKSFAQQGADQTAEMLKKAQQEIYEAEQRDANQ